MKIEQTGISALTKTIQLLFLSLKWLILFMFILFIFSGAFFVRENEQAMILRFGKIVEENGSSLYESGRWYWAFPPPIDRVIKIPNKQNLIVKSDNFWMANDNDFSEDQDSILVPGRDGYLITGDLNILHLKASATCQISDSVKYYFQFNDLTRETILKNILSNAILCATSKISVDSALFRNVERLQKNIATIFSAEIGKLDFGINLIDLKIENKMPPLAVKSAFAEVSEFEQRKSTTINRAESYAENTINAAESSAAEILLMANSAKQKRITYLLADVQYFAAILEEFKKNSQSTITTIYTEKIGDAIKLANERFLIPDSENKNRSLRLLLNRDKIKNEVIND